MRMMTRSMLVVSLLTMTVGCGRQGSTGSDAYAPGLGEIMSLQQMRHAKLYFAGQAENWDLAAYELDEIGEGFDDVLKLPSDAQGFAGRAEGRHSAHRHRAAPPT